MSRESKEHDSQLPTPDVRLPALTLAWNSLDEDDLETLAATVAGHLVPGDIVVLKGEVGTGKTTFVRAAARSLGVREVVTSPTYQFARGYEGCASGRPIAVNHLDLYRLEGLDARDALDLDEYLGVGSVTFIEWADPALDLLEEPSVVEFFHRSPSTRKVRLSGPLAVRISSLC